VGIHSGAMLENRTIQQGIERVVNAMGVSKAQVVSQFEQATLLKRLSTAADTARVAAFLASDGARTITGTFVNASSGRIID
jgi:enoyl-[acyl-carrier-protein] reductase (NADH)